MDAKINRQCKKYQKKGMPKMMPKFDAENNLESAILGAIWIHVGDAGR